jgi:hypothetical protein
MWLVLAESTDAAAAWAAAGLARRGLRPLHVVTGEQLGSTLRWEHRVGAGPPSVDVTLADGRRVRSAEVRGTLNRLIAVPAAAVARVERADREYARSELFALYASWLHALPGRVINPPSALGLSGRWRAATEWTALAAQAGLAVEPVRMSGDRSAGGAPVGRRSDATVIVAARQVVGAPLPAEARQACVRLAELADTPLLGIELARGCSFVDASPWPNLTAGGEPLLDALAAALMEPAA